MGTSYRRCQILPVRSPRLVAWQIDLRRKPRPARKANGEPRVLRLARLKGPDDGGSPDGTGVIELTLCLETWAQKGLRS